MNSLIDKFLAPAIPKGEAVEEASTVDTIPEGPDISVPSVTEPDQVGLETKKARGRKPKANTDEIPRLIQVPKEYLLVEYVGPMKQLAKPFSLLGLVKGQQTTFTFSVENDYKKHLPKEVATLYANSPVLRVTF